ncbi:MAG TPA: S9 family peptidase [Pseudonocardiaceae bacterium]|nr:S9 family peptidase [Pseudonocardiaceae bacterium]
MTITPKDLAALKLAGSPALAPDGSRVVAAVQSVDADDLVYRSSLWSFHEDGEPTPLAPAGPWSDTAPVFAPDGEHVAFLSTRDGRRQAYVESGRSARSLGALDGEVTALVWLDDHRLAGVVEHKPVIEAGAPIVVEWLRYKRDGGPSFVEPTQELWLFDLAAPAARLIELSGRVSCLTAARGTVVYALEERHSDEQSPPTRVHRYDPHAGTEEVLWECPSQIGGLAATSLSGTVVAVASAVAGHSVTPPRLWLLDGAGGATRAFPEADVECERGVLGDARPLGRSAVVQPVAGTDRIVFLGTTGVRTTLFIGDQADAEPTPITPEDCTVTDFSVGHDGVLAACVESPTRPAEVHLVTLAPSAPRRISALNDDWLADAEPTEPEPVSVTAPDGTELAGLLYRAPEGDGSLVVRVHGGPHLAWGRVFDVENQVLLSAGHHVLLPNLRGSAGRGEAFRALTVGDWGGGDHADLMAFTDWAAGVADRLYLVGGSYGGFMVNWTLTRTTRFRAAVSERSISNFVSKVGTSDNGFTVNRHEWGDADVTDETAAALLAASPLRHAAAIETPLLLIHGEDDYRCPVEQSEQLFVALRRLGVPAKFARFPGATHTLSTTGRPDQRIARLQLMLDWLAEHN